MPPLFILLVAVVGLGMVLIVFVRIISGLVAPRSSGQRLARPPANLTTSMADDGFWITSEGLSPSTMLQYYYWIHGVQRMGQVPFEPGPDGRQFIYTGEAPDTVSVVLADAALSAVLPEQDSPPIIPTRLPTPRRSSSSTSHFPRAY
jgi:hypothetical protein